MPPKKANKKAEAAKEEPKKEEPKKEEPKKEEVPKRKAEEKEEDAQEPAKKEQKTEAKEEEEKKDVPPAEKVEEEKDAPADKRPVIKETVGFNGEDLTLNVIPTMGDKLLTAMNEGGLQYLIAGARGNIGIKAGRYMFEIRIMEVLNPFEGGQGRSRPPMPRNLVRVGFSTAGSPLVLGGHENHVCFDSEGQFQAGAEKKTWASQRFTRDQVIGVLLNLDPKSPNKNTISLFRQGERISEPQQIPESLHGKVLFPHISFRNVTVQVSMGPAPLKPLPFKCRTIQDAANADAVVSQTTKDKFNVVFPVGFPDEGTFDWLETFLAKNPDYVELSDRKLLEWATSSGLWKHKGANWSSSNDKPAFNFGLPGMDDMSVQRIINIVAPIVPRNYVVMEVLSNLVADDRKDHLQRFVAPHYKKIAHVVMGEPSAEWKKAQQDAILNEKQDKATAQWKAKTLEVERKKQISATRDKQIADAKKKMEERAAAVAAKKAAVEAKKEAADGEKKMDVDEEKKEDVKEEKKEDGEKEVKDEKKEDGDKEEKKEEDLSAEPPVVELTEEEKNTWFRPKNPTDLTQAALNSAFSRFSIPEKTEGFDEVTFHWQKEAKSKEYLRKWVLERKITARIEDLQPSQWFQDKLKELQKELSDFQAKRDGLTDGKSTEDAEKKDGDDEETKPEAVDIQSVEDVCNANGELLFKSFAFEDWALLQLRYELVLLAHAFLKDTADPERVGIHEDNLNFYYNKYYRKQFAPKAFGVTENAELVALVKDTMAWNDKKVLTTSVAEDIKLDYFVKLAEERRRERQRRIDAGDETARLKFTPQAMQQAGKVVVAAAGQGQPQWGAQKGDGNRQWNQQRSTPYGQTGQTAFRPAGATGKKGAGGKGQSWGRSW